MARRIGPRRLWRAATSRLRRHGRWLFEFAVVALYAPLFLLRHRRRFAGELVHPAWYVSFGHTVLGFDWTSRLYHPHRLWAIQLPTPNSNPYVARCFAHNIDVTIFPWTAPNGAPAMLFGHAVGYAVLRFYLYLIAAMDRRLRIVEPYDAYRTLAPAITVRGGDESTDSVSPVRNQTGYMRLLAERIGVDPALPAADRAACEAAIRAAHPRFFERPFVTLLLRRKGAGSGQFDTEFRCAGPAANYLPAVEHALQRGFHVVGTGETEHATFARLPGYFSLDGLAAPPGLLNLYLLMHCRLFVGQQSGPHVVPNAVGVPCLITDALPHRLGTFAGGDINLYKHLHLPGRDAPLSMVEVYRDHADLALGHGFARKRVGIAANSAAEILAAMREALDLLADPAGFTAADRALAERVRQLADPTMPVRYHPSRPPMFVLRALRAELDTAQREQGIP